MSGATAELQERPEDSCQKGMLSAEAWGTGLLLLMALGLPDRGREGSHVVRASKPKLATFPNFWFPDTRKLLAGNLQIRKDV